MLTSPWMPASASRRATAPCTGLSTSSPPSPPTWPTSSRRYARRDVSTCCWTERSSPPIESTTAGRGRIGGVPASTSTTAGSSRSSVVLLGEGRSSIVVLAGGAPASTPSAPSSSTASLIRRSAGVPWPVPRSVLDASARSSPRRWCSATGRVAADEGSSRSSRDRFSAARNQGRDGDRGDLAHAVTSPRCRQGFTPVRPALPQVAPPRSVTSRTTGSTRAARTASAPRGRREVAWTPVTPRASSSAVEAAPRPRSPPVTTSRASGDPHDDSLPGPGAAGMPRACSQGHRYWYVAARWRGAVAGSTTARAWCRGATTDRPAWSRTRTRPGACARPVPPREDGLDLIGQDVAGQAQRLDVIVGEQDGGLQPLQLGHRDGRGRSAGAVSCAVSAVVTPWSWSSDRRPIGKGEGEASASVRSTPEGRARRRARPRLVLRGSGPIPRSARG